jgi:hypothetical protein
MKRALEGLLVDWEEFAVFSTALEGPDAWQDFEGASRIAVGISECTIWATHNWGGDPPLRWRGRSASPWRPTASSTRLPSLSAL